MAMRISEQMRVSCAQIFNELSQAQGATADERVKSVLLKYGWDKELNRIKDKTLLAVLMEMLHGKALRKPATRNESSKPALDVELDRWRAETDKIAADGHCGDLVADEFVGMETPQLAGKLPRETYFVPSLGDYVSRDDLPSKLAALAELRSQTRKEYLERESGQDVLRREMFIFDELIRRGAGDRAGAEMNPVATGPH